MTDKDPKDMTASEILRDCARRSTRPELAASEYYFPETYVDDYTCDLCGLFRALADKIDAELSKALELSMRQGAELWAKANGWPDFREGEDFGAWLDRCALPRPRFEDGEPVQMGDEIAICGGDIDVNNVVMLLDGSGYRLLHSTDVSASAIEDRVKRPAPDALGADGKPIKAGETVYDIETGEAYIVRLPCAGTGKTFFEGGGYRDPAYLTHTPPDTQERIDADAAKDHVEYWRCSGFDCAECPSKIDGEKPWERYECSGACCDHAMMLDLLRRQRELDKRTGGAE